MSSPAGRRAQVRAGAKQSQKEQAVNRIVAPDPLQQSQQRKAQIAAAHQNMAAQIYARLAADHINGLPPDTAPADLDHTALRRLATLSRDAALFHLEGFGHGTVQDRAPAANQDAGA